MYCGDETGAFVGDCGLTSCRFGFGGEDCPKVRFIDRSGCILQSITIT